MEIIEWDDSLSVGIDQIDEQHRILIQRLADLSKAVETHQGVPEIMKTLEFMMDYTDYHFSTEERHMAELNYPGQEHHKAQHGEFISSLDRLVEDFEEEGATRAVSVSINTFLVNWLIKHIKEVDVEFGRFLREGGFRFDEGS